MRIASFSRCAAQSGCSRSPLPHARPGPHHRRGEGHIDVPHLVRANGRGSQDSECRTFSARQIRQVRQSRLTRQNSAVTSELSLPGAGHASRSGARRVTDGITADNQAPPLMRLPFVARTGAFADITAALDGARHARGSLVLITGEPESAKPGWQRKSLITPKDFGSSGHGAQQQESRAPCVHGRCSSGR